MKRSRLILILMILLCAALVYAWVATPRRQQVSTPASGRAQSMAATERSLEELAEVEELVVAERISQPYRKPVKNLFGALYQPPGVVPRSKPKPRPRPEPQREVVESVVMPAEPVGPPPMKPLKLLGFLIKEARYVAFLAATDGAVYLVRNGDVFADNLVVEDISEKSIQIKKRDTGQQMTLTMGKLQSQRLPAVKIVSDRPQVIPPKPELPDKKEDKKNEEDGFDEQKKI